MKKITNINVNNWMNKYGNNSFSTLAIDDNSKDMLLKFKEIQHRVRRRETKIWRCYS